MFSQYNPDPLYLSTDIVERFLLFHRAQSIAPSRYSCVYLKHFHIDLLREQPLSGLHDSRELTQPSENKTTYIDGVWASLFFFNQQWQSLEISTVRIRIRSCYSDKQHNLLKNLQK